MTGKPLEALFSKHFTVKWKARRHFRMTLSLSLTPPFENDGRLLLWPSNARKESLIPRIFRPFWEIIFQIDIAYRYIVRDSPAPRISRRFFFLFFDVALESPCWQKNKKKPRRTLEQRGHWRDQGWRRALRAGGSVKWKYISVSYLLISSRFSNCGLLTKIPAFKPCKIVSHRFPKATITLQPSNS